MGTLQFHVHQAAVGGFAQQIHPTVADFRQFDVVPALDGERSQRPQRLPAVAEKGLECGIVLVQGLAEPMQ